MSVALIQRFRSNKDALGFTLFACVLSSIFLGFYLSLPRDSLRPFEAITANSVYALLRVIGFNVSRYGNIVSGNNYSIKVIDECLGIEILLLSAAFVLAFPAPWRKKLIAGAIGFPVLLMVNVFRMVILFLICSYQKNWFEYAHLYLGQFMMLIAVVSLFLIWLASLNSTTTLSSKRWFLLRLIVSSCVFFLLWSFFQKPYVHLTESLLSPLAQRITGFPVGFDNKETYDYTFGIATFLSLIFAERNMVLSKRLFASSLGILIQFLFHIAFRILAIFAVVHKGGVPYYMSIGVYALSTILIPLLLWVSLRKLGRMLTKCPFCKIETINMRKHIRKRHGQDALDACIKKHFVFPGESEGGLI